MSRNDNYDQLDYVLAYIKHNDINKIPVNTLLQILDFITTNKDLYLKYYHEKDLQVLNKLWLVISIVAGVLLFRYSRITGISAGALLAYAPNFALSKIGTIEYNELVEKLNSTINEKMTDDSLSRNLVISKKEGQIWKRKPKKS